MSWLSADDPKCETIEEERSPIETVIVPRARDLGDFEVRRALPSSKKQMIGPFIFFDQMGPAEFLLGRGMDVRLIAGSLYGESSPVPTFSDMFYSDCALESGEGRARGAGSLLGRRHPRDRG
jgi:redox-sensitive bicupin YhaK (pirin superfamily)